MEQTLATNEANYHTMHHDGEDQDLRSIFLNILALEELDIRDKKSAIIDFIAAGIETVSKRNINYINILIYPIHPFAVGSYSAVRPEFGDQ